MKINWKVRIKNPVWWAQVIIAIVSPILVGLGLQWSDMTTWKTLGQALFDAIRYCVRVDCHHRPNH